MQDFVCEQCAKPFQAEELPRRGEVCFGCHVRTVQMKFTYGKDDFHGPTIRERQEQTVADAKINGYNAEPVGTRWV
jgi:cytochrome c5